MNRTSTFRELFWDNPMTLEATRTMRRFLRAGMSDENPVMGRRLNTALFCLLGGLYVWTLFLVVRTHEDLSQFFLNMELVVLTLAVPGSLFGAIAVEREKQTYDALIMTRLTPAQIVYGKLWWRVGMIAALMGIFILPIFLTHFSSQSRNLEYTLTALIGSQVQIFLWSLCVGAFSLWVSTKAKKGITALLAIVGTLLVFLGGIPALGSLFAFSTRSEYTPLSPFDYVVSIMTCLNPFYELEAFSTHFRHDDRLGQFWLAFAMAYLSGVVFVLLTAGFLRGAIKTLRGLEMPMVDNRKRGSE